MTMIGAGGITLGVSNGDETTESVFVFEPEANIVFDVTQRFRLALGGGYRLVPEQPPPRSPREPGPPRPLVSP